MKSHIVAKIIMIVCFSLIFSYLFLLMREIQIKTPQNEKIAYINKIDKTTFDGKFSMFSYNFCEYLTTKSEVTILFFTFIYSCLIVYMMEITVGVGHSRSEERNKDLSST